MRRNASFTGFRRRSSASHEGFSGETTGQASRGSQDMRPPDTPLLMAPPTSVTGAIHGSGHGASNWIYRQLPPMSELLTISFWLGIFLAKMLALTRPCLPFMFNLAAGLPLVLLAALDLGVTLTRRSSGILDEHASNRAQSGRHLDWGPRTSLVLVGLHFLFAGAMDRFDVLCSPPPDGSAW